MISALAVKRHVYIRPLFTVEYLFSEIFLMVISFLYKDFNSYKLEGTQMVSTATYIGCFA